LPDTQIKRADLRKRTRRLFELEVGMFMYYYVLGGLTHSLSDMFTFIPDIHIYETRLIPQMRHFSTYTVNLSNSLLCIGPEI